MTLGEAKRQTLAILDEYSVGGEVQLDRDIELRLNPLFDTAQKILAGYAPIRKTVTVSGETYSLPPTFIRLLAAYDESGTRIFPERIGDELSIPGGYASLDILKSPETIDSDTPDDYEFEIKDTLCAAAPYYVAAALNLADLVVNPSYLMSFYNNILQAAVAGASPYRGTVRAL